MAAGVESSRWCVCCLEQLLPDVARARAARARSAWSVGEVQLTCSRLKTSLVRAQAVETAAGGACVVWSNCFQM